MSRIALLSYNNYYNRLFKIEDSLSAYLTAASKYTLLDKVNFNPSDGVTTTLIVGQGNSPFTTWDDGSPDYLIVYETGTADVIKSRWFILDEDRTRAGQYKLTLRRDLLADFNEELATAPIYVEKAIIEDLDNPLLLNNEGLQVNQIKKQEILLKDQTKAPWLCLYVQKGVVGGTPFGEAGSLTGSIPVDVPILDDYAESLGVPIAQWQYYQYADCESENHTHTLDYKSSDNYSHVVRVNFNQQGYVPILSAMCLQYKVSQEGSTVKKVDWTTNYSNLEKTEWSKNWSIARAALDGTYKTYYSTIVSQYKTLRGYKSYNDIMRYDGKTIKDSTGKYYEVHVTPGKMQTLGWYGITSVNAPTLFTYLTSYWNTAAGQSVSPNGNAFAVSDKYQIIRITLIEKKALETVIDFSSYTGHGTIDNPLYDVICMPWEDGVWFTNPGELLHHPESTKSRSLMIMNNLATALGSKALDLQLLPYCPCQDKIATFTTQPAIYLSDVSDSAIIGHTSGSALITDVILVADNSTVTFDINTSINAMNFESLSASYLPEYCPDTYKKKYINDCTSLRLCSPNYNGLFEMNLAKNNMSIDRFNVDMTLRPFNPYLHVNPNFKGLYGDDWNTIQGLICNGDFSLGIIRDAWVQYELQNKNYQAIFDRQIQSMDKNNAIARQEAGWQIAGGTVQGAAGGAVAGAAAGGPWGAVAGAVIGGAASTAGGIMDYANLSKRQKEARDLAIDNFNMQLGNIQALPYSITKTSALTANNKLFPFVEIYECTDVEKEAYFNKLNYDGFTIGVITHSFNDYRSNNNSHYFKGQLIRNTAIEGSTHEVEELAAELNKGVYI